MLYTEPGSWLGFGVSHNRWVIFYFRAFFGEADFALAFRFLAFSASNSFFWTKTRLLVWYLVGHGGTNFKRYRKNRFLFSSSLTLHKADLVLNQFPKKMGVKKITYMCRTLLTSLALSLRRAFSMIILKLNAKRSPEMSTMFGTYILLQIIVWA